MVKDKITKKIIRRKDKMTRQDKPPYLKILELLRKNDPEFSEILAQTLKAVEGKALDKKTKELIKLAMASILGVEEGVKIHSREARNLGATKEEIAETVRIVFLSAGIPGLYSAIKAFEIED